MTADRWEVGEPYERYVGRWSRPVAAAFVDWLAPPPGRRWLDVGAGTGALSGQVLAGADPARILLADRAAGFLGLARARLRDERAQPVLADARRLPVPTGGVDLTVSALVLNFVPEPGRAVAEWARATAHGGTVAAYVWDYADGMRMLRHFWDVAAALDPDAAELDEATRFPLCHPDRLEALWTAAGLVEVSTRPIDVPTVFRGFDDFWQPFLGGQGPAPGYLAGCPPEHRERLRGALRERLTAADDGTIALTARAFAVRGTVVR
jgi:SAM-dependent methyltransferase